MGLFDSVLDALSGVPSKESIDREEERMKKYVGGVDYELEQLEKTEDEIKKYRKELADKMKQFDD